MSKSTAIQNLRIIEIDNFISDEEIQTILQSRIENFESAIGHYPKYYRNNDRIVEDNPLLSSMLFNRLKDITAFKKEIKDKVIGINERIRFCKYQKDQLFSKHQDGTYYPSSTSESKFTFLLYLNGAECFEGGYTEFYTSKIDEHPIKTIIPKKGKLIIFDHKIWHKGALVTQGNKYILRSDIIIEKQNKTTHHDGYIWNLLKLNEDRFLSCGRDTKIKLWNTDLELLNTISIHSKSILKMICFNESEFISCSRDFTIKRWDLSGKIISVILFDEMILNIKIDINKNIIAVGTSGKLYVLNSDLNILKTIKIHEGWIWGLSIKSDNTIITCSEDNTVNETNIRLGVTKCIYTHDQPLFCLSTLINNIIYIGSKNGILLKFFMNTKKINKIKAHNDIIRSIICHNERIITCGEDNKVILTDKKLYKTEEMLNSDNFIQDIAILKNRIYGAGYNGVITTKKI
ncbi:2OG-Fe(II) oxygenase [Aquimarina muelleri]|uniref:2OG-Fe(II) oxygenase n=1 Tax=Aquimarina muelleri TaxID=279356 RepID=UPI003F68743A